MSCEFEDDLTAYVDEELAPLRRRQLEAHLGGCPACTGAEARVRRTVEQLALLPAAQPSAAMRAAVLSRLEEPAGLWTRLVELVRRPVVLVPLGAATAAGLVALLSPPEPTLDLKDTDQIELALNMEVVEDLDVLGLESPEDLEVVANLHELEAKP